MPSLLESFYFVFDADTKGVKKGLDEGKSASTELEKSLQGLDKTASKIGIAFVDLAKKASAAVAAVVALGAVKKLVNDTAEHTFAVKQQAQALAISTETLSTWQNAVTLAGGTAEGATQSIGGLQQKLIELARMPGGMTPDGFMLKRLGLDNADLKNGIQDPISVMQKLAGTFGNLSSVQQQFVGKRLGLDQGTIALLAQGRRAFDEHIARTKELGVVTQQQAVAAANFNLQQKELNIVFETVAREVTGVLLPPLTWLLRKIEETVLFLREHKNFTIAFFVGIGVAVASTVVPAFTAAAAAVWAFLAPIIAGPLLVAAIVAAIALLYDDVVAFMNGQNSLLGELAKKWPWLGDIIRSTIEEIMAALRLLNAGIKDLVEYFVAISTFLVDIFTKGPSAALDKLNEKTKNLFNDLKSHFGGVIDGAKNMWSAVTGNGAGKQEEARGLAGTNTPLTSKEQKERGQYIAQSLVKKGWTPEQAAGIAGSLLQESGGNEKAVNKTSGAEGIGQWLGVRKKNFEKYAGHSLAQSTLDEQINFMNYELTQGDERGAGKRLKAAQTPEEAARIHSQYYERPGAAEANNARREQNALMIAQAQKQIGDANSNPVNGQNSQTIANNVRNGGNKTITVGGSTIVTQASDPRALAKGYSDHLHAQLKGAQDQDDDGIAA